MSGFTPGPWNVADEKDGNLWIDGRGNAGVAKIEPWDRLNGQGEVLTDEDRANARLIAAAPAMAELLLSAYQHVSHGGPTRGELEAVLRQAGLIE